MPQTSRPPSRRAEVRRQLIAGRACREGINWAKRQPSPRVAWTACPRGDWMLWWVGRGLTRGPMPAERRLLVRVACACARLALPLVKKGNGRPRRAIALAERWANGSTTVGRDQLMACAAAAVSADAYADAAGAYAASAAAYADAAADAYVNDSPEADADAQAAARAACIAAASAAYAAAGAAADGEAARLARARVHAACADLVRAAYPNPPLIRRGKPTTRSHSNTRGGNR